MPVSQRDGARKHGEAPRGLDQGDQRAARGAQATGLEDAQGDGRQSLPDVRCSPASANDL